ncbi:MAG: tryptophan synthase alpha chain, partial [Actinomycetota bacterium]
MTGRLETELRRRRDAGRKVLVPYVTGGYPGWADAVRAAAANGADAIEIGIPFSDPVMDGPVIQQASQAALEAGATPLSILDEIRHLDVEIPLVVMTYYNLVHHDGHRRFAHRLVEAGVSGCILPDLPLEESDPWCA